MDVETTNDVRDYEIYETEKFKFRIEKEWIEKMKEKKDWEIRLRTKVMKSIRLTAKVATGKDWEDSCNAIIDEIL